MLAHNKTLAAQLYHEFKTFFPSNAVEYFVSYYDYYQPEAYIPSSDVYIEKEATINDELDRLRLSATRSLFERRDCVIVASVSCIYGLGSPEAYYGMLLMLEKGQQITRKEIISKLVDILYDRNDHDFQRGAFRVRGDVIEVCPAYDENAYRIEMFGDEVESLSQIDPLLGQVKQTYQRLPIYPKTHYVMSRLTKEAAIEFDQSRAGSVAAAAGSAGQADRSAAPAPAHHVRSRNDERDRLLPRDRKLLTPFLRTPARRSAAHAARLSSHDSIMYIDESHQTIPQLHGMYHGDRSRKEILVAHGFRLPSALDNRPLTFEEFEHRVSQVVYVSATPGPYELTKSAASWWSRSSAPPACSIPKSRSVPSKARWTICCNEIRQRVALNQRVLVTTLTKRMAEDLAEYYSEVGVKCNYLHSEVSTLDRMKILRDLRRGEFDVLIGINLLREGLDLPEVSLVAILDADKEGFLRSTGALIQTMGRAARHLEGRAILYADVMTDSMKRAIDETNRRRITQDALQRGKRHHPAVDHQAHRHDAGGDGGRRLRHGGRKSRSSRTKT